MRNNQRQVDASGKPQHRLALFPPVSVLLFSFSGMQRNTVGEVSLLSSFVLSNVVLTLMIDGSLSNVTPPFSVLCLSRNTNLPRRELRDQHYCMASQDHYATNVRQDSADSSYVSDTYGPIRDSGSLSIIMLLHSGLSIAASLSTY